MNNLFFGCSSLVCLPDISRWNIKNVISVKNLFFNCHYLQCLPDLSKWNLFGNNIDENSLNSFLYDNIFNKIDDDIFQSSKKIYPLFNKNYKNNLHLPDMDFNLEETAPNKEELINNFKRSLYNISELFTGCSSLKSIPDISKWNITKVRDLHYLFSGCSSLQFLPDISIWDTENVIDIFGLFYGCNSLTVLPDISKWNTKNVTSFELLFAKCTSLISLPDISKWNIKAVNDEQLLNSFSKNSIFLIFHFDKSGRVFNEEHP